MAKVPKVMGFHPFFLQKGTFNDLVDTLFTGDGDISWTMTSRGQYFSLMATSRGQ